MKLYAVTETNYQEILNRIAKFTNNYKMISKCNIYKVSDRNGKKSRYTNKKSVIIPSKFIEITIYPMYYNYKEYLTREDDVNWEIKKPIIYIDKDAGSATIIRIGDKIKITNYGFIVCTNNHYDGNDLIIEPKYIHEETFVIDKSAKIQNIKEEREIRWKDWAWYLYDEESSIFE